MDPDGRKKPRGMPRGAPMQSLPLRATGPSCYAAKINPVEAYRIMYVFLKSIAYHMDQLSQLSQSTEKPSFLADLSCTISAYLSAPNLLF